MNAFNKCRAIEEASLNLLRPMIRQRSYGGQYVITDKGRLAQELQKAYGDVIFNDENGQIQAVECKAETENRHGNLFLETWSNRSRYTVGWMITNNADWLLYHFLACGSLYVFDFQHLKRWAWCDGRIYSFKERGQAKYDQINDTWGRCVPAKVLLSEVRGKVLQVEPLPEFASNQSDGRNQGSLL